MTIWAVNFSAMKYALAHGFSPLAFTAPRYVLAGVLLALVVLWRERSLRVGRRDAGPLAAAAVAGVLVNQIAVVYALELADVATVALIFGSAPVLVALLAHATGVERVGRVLWVAAAVSAGGVALVVAGAGDDVGAGAGAIALGLVNAATWAVASVAIAPLTRRHSPLRLNAVVTLAGALPLAAVAAVALARQDWGAVTPLAWGAFAFSALAACVIANLVWFAAIGRVGAPRAAVYANVEPFLAALVAALLLSEAVAPLQVAGGAALALGIALARSRPPVARPGGAA